MAQVKDPVCGMMVDPATAAGSITLGGRTYYFCSASCLRTFEANPAAYANAAAEGTTVSDREVPLERHEPPRTTTGPMTAPKFGSAGSGGLELEPLPERHDRDRDTR